VHEGGVSTVCITMCPHSNLVSIPIWSLSFWGLFLQLWGLACVNNTVIMCTGTGSVSELIPNYSSSVLSILKIHKSEEDEEDGVEDWRKLIWNPAVEVVTFYECRWHHSDISHCDHRETLISQWNMWTVEKVVTVMKRQMRNPNSHCLVSNLIVLKLSGYTFAPTW